MNGENDKAVNTLAKGVIEGTAAFLGKICLPAAEEFGLLLQDKVNGWRAKNFISIARKTQELLKEKENEVKVHPRILHQVYENGSWVEDDALQNMWAGLLASACDTTGKSDDNLIYVNILSQLTTPQAKLFEHVLKQTYINVSLKILKLRTSILAITDTRVY